MEVIITSKYGKINQEMDKGWTIRSLDVMHQVNRIPYARLEVLDVKTVIEAYKITNSDFFEPGKEIHIQVQHEPGAAQPVFEGMVVRQSLQVDGSDSSTVIDMKHKAFSLTRQRRSAVYEGSDFEIIKNIAEAAGLSMADAPGFADYKHRQLVRYYCTDWDFILSRAEANGHGVLLDGDQLSLIDYGTAGKDQVHPFELGKEKIVEVDLKADGADQYEGVESMSWDIDNQVMVRSNGVDTDLLLGNLEGSDLSLKLGGNACSLLYPAPTEDMIEMDTWANAALKKSRLSLVRGWITVKGNGDIRPGHTLSLSGMGERFEGEALITGVLHQVSTGGWTTAVQVGMSSQWFSRSDDLAWPPASGLLPAIGGLQIGVVDTFKEDTDGKQYRVRVKIPAIEGNAVSTDKAVVWARMAMPDAGNGRGIFFWPEKGDEVVLGFLNNDPRQAVVLGSLYSRKNIPPVEEGSIVEANNEKGIFSREGMQLHFNDETKTLSILTSHEGSIGIVMDEGNKQVVIKDANENTITMNDGGVAIESKGNLTLKASGKVEISGSEVNIA